MSKKMTKLLANAVSITGVAIQTPVRMNESPFLGGGGSGGSPGGARNAILNLGAALGGTPTILIQGHDSLEATAPAAGDAGWYLIQTVNNATALAVEIELAPWMRTNVTVVGTGTMTLVLEGVQ